MLFYFSPLILGCFWPASTLLHGHIALAIPSLLETDPQNLKHWCYADDDHLGKSIRAMDSDLECVRDVQKAFVNRTHRIGFSMFRALRQNRCRLRRLHILQYATPNCRVHFNITTALLTLFFLDLLLGCSSTWRCA